MITFAAMKIQTLHIFNPEHDIALAANLSNFTAPHAGRQLRNDLGFLPALWAGQEDAVLVDSVDGAERAFKRLRGRLGLEECLFVDKTKLAKLDIEHIAPWGWDLALRSTLRRYGVSESLLPTLDEMVQIRLLSHRRTAARLLPELRVNGTTGEAFECAISSELDRLTEKYGQLVVKAPWSSSGRGVSFVLNHDWMRHVVKQQGSVMVEPFYNKVMDLGMEFMATDDGIRYEGLSLFKTKNGAYTGNVLATEEVKRNCIGRYLSLDLLDEVRDKIAAKLDLGCYRGPFGVDMMIVRGGLLHPCVEINLRNTMGHVALILQQRYNPTGDDDIRGVMRVVYDGSNYKLRIEK